MVFLPDATYSVCSGFNLSFFWLHLCFFQAYLDLPGEAFEKCETSNNSVLKTPGAWEPEDCGSKQTGVITSSADPTRGGAQASRLIRLYSAVSSTTVHGKVEVDIAHACMTSALGG